MHELPQLHAAYDRHRARMQEISCFGAQKGSSHETILAVDEPLGPAVRCGVGVQKTSKSLDWGGDLSDFEAGFGGGGAGQTNAGDGGTGEDDLRCCSHGSDCYGDAGVGRAFRLCDDGVACDSTWNIISARSSISLHP